MIIGIDPHKSSHTATAVSSATNTAEGSIRIDATLAGYRELLRWARRFPERRWATENARGLGRHLAQWLVARGETVLDVPATATSRVRELSRGGRRKNDVIDAAAAASVAALHGDADVVRAEDETSVFAPLPGQAPEQFLWPHSIATDSRGELYLAEVSYVEVGSRLNPPLEMVSLRK